MRLSNVAVALTVGLCVAIVHAEDASTVNSDLSGEKYEYQAEVQRLMDIIIHSLYHNKDIFLRELISNASDALDKIRFLSLSDDKALGEGDERNLEIRISFDKDAKTLTIRDRGIGMTKQDMVQNLGTIAKSGTAAFAEQLGAGGDMSLIGQFGVGFYSAYLAADKVRVVSKNNNDKQYIWESIADNTFTIAEDPNGNTLGRGTEITLFLKDDATDYANEETLRGLIKKYSEFITFPIYLRTQKQEQVDVPIEDEASSEDEAATTDDSEEVKAEESKEDDSKPKTRKETRTTYSWELCNDQKAIWQRKPKDITDEEYQAFYKAFSKDSNAPHTWIHFSAEGEVEFRSILFVPSETPSDLYDNYYSKSAALRLYVRRVLISDEFEELMPKYLNFIRGVVDSDDLPLNVSREQLQQHKILKVMGKKLVRKALEMIRKLASDEKKAKEGADKDAEKESEEGSNTLRADAATAYTKFWEKFGKNIKLGIIEDSSNRSKLSKLVRFRTTKTGKDGWRSFDEYVADMPKNQKVIYYISGESYDAVVSSPFLERLQAKNLEVIFMTDPIDEYMLQNLPEYESHRLQSITKEGLVLPGDEKADKKREEAYTEKYKPLIDYLKKVYDDKVEKVVISPRLYSSPVVLVTSQYGYTANMERIIKSQAFGDASRAQYMISKKTMEINPRHPIIATLNELVGEENADENGTAKDIAELLFDTALMNSGFTMEDSKAFSARMYRLMATGLKLDNLETLPEIPVTVEEEEEEADDDEAVDEEVTDEEGNDEL